MVKKGVKSINAVKKRVKHVFLTLSPSKNLWKNVLFMVQTTSQRLLVQSDTYTPYYTYIPDFIFRKNTIMA